MARYQAIKIVGDNLVLDEDYPVLLPPQLRQGTSARARVELDLRRLREAKEKAMHADPRE